MPETHIDRMAATQAKVAQFVETMDHIADELNRDVVDDPEELFVPMAELAGLWKHVRPKLTIR